MDIIMVAPQSWDFEIGSNARNIALEFSKNHRVLYVNPPTDLISLIKKNNKRLNKSAVERIDSNIWVLTPSSITASINWINFLPVYRMANYCNNKRFASNILGAVAFIGFKDFVVFNDNYMFNGFYLKKLLGAKHYIYYIRDFLTIQPYFKRHGTRLEPKLMSKADAVVANSTYLKEYALKSNPQSFYVGQGCEIEMFDEGLVNEIPESIRKIKAPIIGYVGFLTAMRLDIDLLIELAIQKPTWSTVLVGPEDDVFKKSKLHQLGNVHFLGRKDPSELPAYIKGFDVCINPQAINPLTIGNYPRKVDEYLAMGKPTVATATKAMEVFKDHVYLANDATQFRDLVEKALTENDAEKKASRIAFAKSHTWENSVKEIYSVVDKLHDESK